MIYRWFCKHAAHWSAVVHDWYELCKSGFVQFWIHTCTKRSENKTDYYRLVIIKYTVRFLWWDGKTRTNAATASCQARRQRQTVARRESERVGLPAETRREILTNAAQSFTKRSRKRICQTLNMYLVSRNEFRTTDLNLKTDIFSVHAVSFASIHVINVTDIQ